MKTGFKGREYTLPCTFDVYRNLNNGKLSLRGVDVHNRLVVDHTDRVLLTNCEFKVSESGRQKVIENNRKNVHATVRGEVREFESTTLDTELTYNPFKFESFVTRDEHTPVHTAEKVCIDVSGEYPRFTATNIE